MLYVNDMYRIYVCKCLFVALNSCFDCNDNNEHNPHNHCCDRCDKPTTDASVLSFFPVLATVTISKYFISSIVNATMFLKS